jgi:hypothetical protein
MRVCSSILIIFEVIHYENHKIYYFNLYTKHIMSDKQEENGKKIFFVTFKNYFIE